MSETPPIWTAGLSDADLRNTMLAAMRLLAGLCVVTMALFWWKTDWRGAALVLVGCGISGGSLWGFMGLMTAMNQQMDQGMAARPMGAGAGRFLPAAGAYAGGALC